MFNVIANMSINSILGAISGMSIRGKAEAFFAIVVAFIITVSVSMSVVAGNALQVEKERFEMFKQETAVVIAKTQAITLEELEKEERLKIHSYIKKNFRAIPDSTAKLIAKSTTELGKKYDMPASVIVGMMKVESNFSPSAISPKRARGLMQVRWHIWKKMLGEKVGMQEEHDLHNIKKGIEAGVIVLKHYLEKNKGNISRALYDYVGKNRPYVTKVYETIGRFVAYDKERQFKEEAAGKVKRKTVDKAKKKAVTKVKRKTVTKTEGKAVIKEKAVIKTKEKPAVKIEGRTTGKAGGGTVGKIIVIRKEPVDVRKGPVDKTKEKAVSKS